VQWGAWGLCMNVLLLDTADLGEAEQFLGDTYSRMKLSARTKDIPARTRLTRSTVVGLNVDEVELDFDMTYQMNPIEMVLVQRVYSGALHAQQPGEPQITCRPGEALAIGACEGLPVIGEAHRSHHAIFAVDRDLFSRVAANSPDRDDEVVRLTGQAAVSAKANQYLVAVLDHINATVVGNPSALDSPLAAAASKNYLASAMLLAFPSTALLEPTCADRRDSTPLLLRRAIAFIDDNAYRDISVTDIAAAVYVTPRCLQLMFRKHRGCTPTQYLRTVRLHHAHFDLACHNRTTATVKDVAGKWGFSNVGRFAAAYRRVYGHKPHVTLDS
jgi:AraC-like DNA-binding protein